MFLFDDRMAAVSRLWRRFYVDRLAGMLSFKSADVIPFAPPPASQRCRSHLFAERPMRSLAVLELLPQFRNLRVAVLQLPGHLCMLALPALRHARQLTDLTLAYVFYSCDYDTLFKSPSVYIHAAFQAGAFCNTAAAGSAAPAAADAGAAAPGPHSRCWTQGTLMAIPGRTMPSPRSNSCGLRQSRLTAFDLTLRLECSPSGTAGSWQGCGGVVKKTNKAFAGLSR